MTVSLLGVAPTARAENHMPWDQPGSAWQGTISYSFSATDGPSEQTGQKIVSEGNATYSDLVPLDGTADGNYSGAVTASSSSENWTYCGEAYSNWENVTSDVTVAAGEEACDGCGENPSRLSLLTDDYGTTTFYLGAAHLPFTSTVTGPCSGGGSTWEWYASNGFPYGGPAYGAPIVLSDTDPDPFHLVGSSTQPAPEGYAEYSLTLTYDLWLTIQPPECDTWKEKAVTWKAITPFKWMPDRHWGDYKVRAKWCYDSNADYGELLFIRSRGTVDDGPFGTFARAANFFGFETRWENQKCEPKCGDLSDQKVRQASVSRKMAFCFDFSVLLDKLKVKDWIKEKIRPGLKSKIKAFIEANGGASGPAFSSALLTWVDDIIVKMRNKVDRIDEKLRDRRVPNFLAEWLENQVEGPVNGIMERWKDDVAEDLYMGAYEDTTAGVAADLALGPFVDRIFNIFRICDGGDFLPFTGENYPGLLTLWEPEVTVTVMSDGRARFDRFDIYKHPALDIRRR